MSTYITIYFTIGFIFFLVFQYKASKEVRFSHIDFLRGMAWSSLLAWPIVIAFGLVAGVLCAIVGSIRFINEIIGSLLRSEK